MKLIEDNHKLKIVKFLYFLDDLGIDEFNTDEYTATFSFDNDLKLIKYAKRIGLIEKDGDNYKIIK